MEGTGSIEKDTDIRTSKKTGAIGSVYKYTTEIVINNPLLKTSMQVEEHISERKELVHETTGFSHLYVCSVVCGWECYRLSFYPLGYRSVIILGISLSSAMVTFGYLYGFFTLNILKSVSTSELY